MHVVRDLDPADALTLLVPTPRSIQPCDLPSGKPDEWTSLPAAALGFDSADGATLLAGRIGAWTFVYDDLAFTADREFTAKLSADGRTAATGHQSITGDTGLCYAVDGTRLAWRDSLDRDLDLPGMPGRSTRGVRSGRDSGTGSPRRW
ncbi:hypothetical protein [Pseudonocardia spinosispora]|uniref:hypothetical protein n=1 Tax=Pseudonocardia spinosispora TaxID=103441 RepID=UPI0003FB36AB|nr:hypothetical protein [Pseudonocardia spinosispora]